MIKADSPWFFHVRTLIASRPNLQPVGLGNNNSDIDVSLLLPSRDDDASSASAFDEPLDVPEQLSEAPVDISSDSSDDEDLLEHPTLAGSIKRKRDGTDEAPRKDVKPPALKKRKPAPATSIPATPAVAPVKKTSVKDRFAATIAAEEETQQRMIGLKQQRNEARKEVALRKVELDAKVRLARGQTKREEKERKAELVRLKLEQEHELRMTQFRMHARGPGSMSFSGGGNGPPRLYDDFPRLPSVPDEAGPSNYGEGSFDFSQF